MRLIDADKLVLRINDYALQEAALLNGKVVGKYDAIQECIKAVEEQPTAFDVKKVIAELEEAKKICGKVPYCNERAKNGLCEGKDCFDCCEDYLIDIVKRGGRDEE